MELSGNLAKFRLTAREAYRSGLMNFRSLELVPASAPLTSTGERDLEAARKTFSNAFRQGTADANKTYRESLQRMAAAQKDADLLVRIRREMARLEESPEKLAFSSDEDDGTGGNIVLRPGSGLNWKLRGEVRLDTGVPNGMFTTLRPAPTASISWRLAAWNVPSGSYSIVIKGRVPLTGGGSAELTAAGPGGVSDKAVEVKIDPVVPPGEKGRKPEDGSSPPQAEWRTLEPVQVVIPRGSEYLTLTVSKLTHADGSLMDITSLTLTRTGDVPVPKSP
jgi:hypothetical protein